MPCRKLLPFSKRLYNKYREKEVAFVYVSIDEIFDKWQKAFLEEGLPQSENNLLALNYPKADFYKKLNLFSIPRYLIFDKKGKLIHTSAPYPDSEYIEAEFEKLLK